MDCNKVKEYLDSIIWLADDAKKALNNGDNITILEDLGLVQADIEACFTQLDNRSD